MNAIARSAARDATPFPRMGRSTIIGGQRGRPGEIPEEEEAPVPPE